MSPYEFLEGNPFSRLRPPSPIDRTFSDGPPRPYEGHIGRDFGLYLLAAGLPIPPIARPVGAAARVAGRSLGNFFAPRRVGVHHTMYGRGNDARHMKPWDASRVSPSTTQGRTAGDQIPGMSYFWSGGGRGGSRAAANDARGQTSLMFERMMLNPETQGVGKVVTAPRFGVRPDPNLPGTRAAMVQGPRLRVTGEVAARSGPLSAADASSLSSMGNRQKLIEASRSAGRIGAATGAGAAFQNLDMATIRQMLR